MTREDEIKKQKERQLQNKKKALVDKKEGNGLQIYYLDKERAIISQELQFILNLQKDYYLRILKKGQDSRDRGMIWVIQKLAETGTQATKDMLPHFLDSSSQNFLLQRSKNDMLITEKRNKIKKIKQDEINVMLEEGEDFRQRQNTLLSKMNQSIKLSLIHI